MLENRHGGSASFERRVACVEPGRTQIWPWLFQPGGPTRHAPSIRSASSSRAVARGCNHAMRTLEKLVWIAGLRWPLALKRQLGTLRDDRGHRHGIQLSPQRIAKLVLVAQQHRTTDHREDRAAHQGHLVVAAWAGLGVYLTIAWSPDRCDVPAGGSGQPMRIIVRVGLTGSGIGAGQGCVDLTTAH